MIEIEVELRFANRPRSRKVKLPFPAIPAKGDILHNPIPSRVFNFFEVTQVIHSFARSGYDQTEIVAVEIEENRVSFGFSDQDVEDN